MIFNPLFIMNMDGGNAREVHLDWLHGWSPDSKYILYTQNHGDNFDIYRINAAGSGEVLMTTNKGQDDGPEYSADGKWIYFCSTAPASGMGGQSACIASSSSR